MPVLAALLVAAPSLAAQPGTEGGQTDPSDPAEPVDQPPLVNPRTPVAEPERALPAGPVRPGLAEDVPLFADSTELREGTFITQARGRIGRGSRGAWYFVPGRDESGRRLPVMVLLPGQYRSVIERQISRTDQELVFLLTGQVLRYYSQHALHLTAVPLIESLEPTDAPDARPADNPAPEPGDEQPTEQQAQPEGGNEGNENVAPDDARQATATTADQDDPSVESLIAEIEQDRAPSDLRDSAAMSLRVADTSDAGETPRRRTAQLTDRTGRLVRGTGGAWVFVVDSGPDDEPEPPLIVLPCRNLMAMEQLVERHGETVRFTLSGRIETHDRVGYILPTLFRVQRRDDNVMSTQ